MTGGNEEMTSAFLRELGSRPACWGVRCVRKLGKWRQLEMFSCGAEEWDCILQICVLQPVKLTEGGFILF